MKACTSKFVDVFKRARGKMTSIQYACKLIGAQLIWLSCSQHLFAQSVDPNQLPTGGQVKAGQASIESNQVNGQTGLTIHQQSDRAVIDWQTFDLGSAAAIEFKQPNAQSSTLNRVLDINPSQVHGVIHAPGQVILINPNGVLFGKTARVDVGALVATTHDIANDQYMQADYTFERKGATGSVLNQGQIRAALGQYVALLAPEVINEGLILAKQGSVVMANGERITLNFGPGHHLTGIAVDPSVIQTHIENKHAIRVEGGLILMSAQVVQSLQTGLIKNSGQLIASTGATTLSEQGGRIVLEGHEFNVDPSSVIQTNQLVVHHAETFEIDRSMAKAVSQALTQSTDVTLRAQGDVKLKSDVHITKSDSSRSTLTFQSAGNIALQKDSRIHSQQGPLNLVLQSNMNRNRSGSILIAGQISTAGGGIWAGGGAIDHSKLWRPSHKANKVPVGLGYAFSSPEQSYGILVSKDSQLNTKGAHVVFRGEYAPQAVALVNNKPQARGAGIQIEGQIHSDGGMVSLFGRTAEGTSADAKGVYLSPDSVIDIGDGKLKLVPNADSELAGLLKGSGDLEIMGSNRSQGKYFISDKRWQIVSKNMSLAEYVLRLSAATQSGRAVFNGASQRAGIYDIDFDQTNNTATFQVKQFDDRFTKVVFVSLKHYNGNVQAKATFAGYKSGNHLDQTLKLSDLKSIGMVATEASHRGYGIDRLFLSNKVTLSGVSELSGSTILRSKRSLSDIPTNVFTESQYAILELNNPIASSKIINDGLLILKQGVGFVSSSSISGAGAVLGDVSTIDGMLDVSAQQQAPHFIGQVVPVFERRKTETTSPAVLNQSHSPAHHSNPEQIFESTDKPNVSNPDNPDNPGNQPHPTASTPTMPTSHGPTLASQSLTPATQDNIHPIGLTARTPESSKPQEQRLISETRDDEADTTLSVTLEQVASTDLLTTRLSQETSSLHTQSSQTRIDERTPTVNAVLPFEVPQELTLIDSPALETPDISLSSERPAHKSESSPNAIEVTPEKPESNQAVNLAVPEPTAPEPTAPESTETQSTPVDVVQVASLDEIVSTLGTVSMPEVSANPIDITPETPEPIQAVQIQTPNLKLPDLLVPESTTPVSLAPESTETQSTLVDVVQVASLDEAVSTLGTASIPQVSANPIDITPVTPEPIQAVQIEAPNLKLPDLLVPESTTPEPTAPESTAPESTETQSTPVDVVQVASLDEAVSTLGTASIPQVSANPIDITPETPEPSHAVQIAAPNLKLPDLLVPESTTPETTETQSTETQSTPVDLIQVASLDEAVSTVNPTNEIKELPSPIEITPEPSEPNQAVNLEQPDFKTSDLTVPEPTVPEPTQSLLVATNPIESTETQSTPVDVVQVASLDEIVSTLGTVSMPEVSANPIDITPETPEPIQAVQIQTPNLKLPDLLVPESTTPESLAPESTETQSTPVDVVQVATLDEAVSTLGTASIPQVSANPIDITPVTPEPIQAVQIEAPNLKLPDLLVPESTTPEPTAPESTAPESTETQSTPVDVVQVASLDEAVSTLGTASIPQVSANPIDITPETPEPIQAVQIEEPNLKLPDLLVPESTTPETTETQSTETQSTPVDLIQVATLDEAVSTVNPTNEIKELPSPIEITPEQSEPNQAVNLEQPDFKTSDLTVPEPTVPEPTQSVLVATNPIESTETQSTAVDVVQVATLDEAVSTLGTASIPQVSANPIDITPDTPEPIQAVQIAAPNLKLPDLLVPESTTPEPTAPESTAPKSTETQSTPVDVVQVASLDEIVSTLGTVSMPEVSANPIDITPETPEPSHAVQIAAPNLKLPDLLVPESTTPETTETQSTETQSTAVDVVQVATLDEAVSTVNPTNEIKELPSPIEITPEQSEPNQAVNLEQPDFKTSDLTVPEPTVPEPTQSVLVATNPIEPSATVSTPVNLDSGASKNDSAFVVKPLNEIKGSSESIQVAVLEMAIAENTLTKQTGQQSDSVVTKPNGQVVVATELKLKVPTSLAIDSGLKRVSTDDLTVLTQMIASADQHVTQRTQLADVTVSKTQESRAVPTQVPNQTLDVFVAQPIKHHTLSNRAGQIELKPITVAHKAVTQSAPVKPMAVAILSQDQAIKSQDTAKPSELFLMTALMQTKPAVDLQTKQSKASKTQSNPSRRDHTTVAKRPQPIAIKVAQTTRSLPNLPSTQAFALIRHQDNLRIDIELDLMAKRPRQTTSPRKVLFKSSLLVGELKIALCEDPEYKIPRYLCDS